MLDAKIKKTGVCIPNTFVTNDDLSKVMDTNHDWIYQRTGIAKRAIAKDESLLDLTKKAVIDLALNDEEFQSVDAIIIASMSFELKSPGLSSLIQNEFNFRDDIMCFDINVACSGYVYAFDIARTYIKSGIYKNVLVIGADKMSNIIDPLDRSTAILFADGVSCSLLTADEKEHVLFRYMNTTGNKEPLQCVDKLEMKGQDVFRFAVGINGNCLDMVDKEIGIENVDYFLFHQANVRIIDNLIKKYKLDESKVIKNIENLGNTSSASVGILLNDIKENIKEGDVVMMTGFGSGLTYGCLVYKH